MNLIYVDDEYPARNNFRLTIAPFLEVESLQLFGDGESALEWAAANPVDAAFLDMEMPGLHGLELAKKLKALDPNISIVFVTAYSQYALDAFSVDAIGYVMKPYLPSDIRKELDKAARVRKIPKHRVEIKTIPTFSVTIDGNPFHMGRLKALELFALLVDRGESGITTGEGIACLWPERAGDTNTASLFRMTYKRLQDALEEAGVGDIIGSEENRRFICVDKVECDLYRLLAGDPKERRRYSGQYLREYSWAEEQNAALDRMIFLEKY